ncbi:TetR/AcrR family transcriptional regulator [Shewanella saliphila]|uniref:HTH tetR-type domain-containing protein n=1 Tax=Shewanella saliphila TaxID=2282698 RepID=A0ABQ2QDD8_9GAMM|nr:TetR/AcrR family transcriptional regulator [Shewanella saliphila]MCL1103482.1 TetR family transcriptional regulator [Shewanella saliphila]GGP69880.1 hypothetical protein GCM10009409_38250 [Shewanella saliphila]
MTAELSTREKLIHHARLRFWTKGYSNVSLREISRAAGVDVALVSRNFGGKQGLFEATLEGALVADGLPQSGIAELVDMTVSIMASTPKDEEQPSIIRLIQMNAHDETVGELVREQQKIAMQNYLEQVIGDKTRAALFMVVLLGISMAEASLHLTGIAKPESQEYEKQLRHMLSAALNY